MKMIETLPPLPQGRGRPRSARAHRAILDATIDLLIEAGYRGMSVEGVADRAGVGKTTIYRRWPAKEALVADALAEIEAEMPVVDTGDTRADLLALLDNVRHVGATTRLGQLLPRLIGEVGSNPALFQVVQEKVIAPRLRLLTGPLERAVARGELRADLDPAAVVTALIGPAFFLVLVPEQLFPHPPDIGARLIDDLWRGIAAE